MNPDNVPVIDEHYFPEEVYSRVPWALRVVGFIWAALFALGILLVHNPPTDTYQFLDSLNDDSSTLSKSPKTQLTLKECLLSK